MADDLEDTIRQNAQAPASASMDGASAAQHPLRDQIEADRHLAARKAAKSPTFGLRIGKIVPPGRLRTNKVSTPGTVAAT
ncbi:MAG: hypothetical protein WD066_04020 [Planctomycetaceae bacterium]